jgi:hypothetical protein
MPAALPGVFLTLTTVPQPCLGAEEAGPFEVEEVPVREPESTSRPARRLHLVALLLSYVLTFPAGINTGEAPPDTTSPEVSPVVVVCEHTTVV